MSELTTENQVLIHVICFNFLQENKNLLNNPEVFCKKLTNHLKKIIEFSFKTNVSGSTIKLIFNKEDIFVIPLYEFTFTS
jgi:hypothetical protein